MSVQDQWLTNFKTLIASEIEAAGGHVASAYRSAAQKTGIGADYIYQIYKGAPKRDGSPRLPSIKVAKAFAKAYGAGKPENWFDLPPQAQQAAPTQALDLGLTIGTVPAVLAFSEKAKTLSETQRKYMAMLLSDLILQPDKAPELAIEIARLLGDQSPGKPLQPASTLLKNGSSG